MVPEFHRFSLRLSGFRLTRHFPRRLYMIILGIGKIFFENFGKIFFNCGR